MKHGGGGNSQRVVQAPVHPDTGSGTFCPIGRAAAICVHDHSVAYKYTQCFSPFLITARERAHFHLTHVRESVCAIWQRVSCTFGLLQLHLFTIVTWVAPLPTEGDVFQSLWASSRQQTSSWIHNPQSWTAIKEEKKHNSGKALVWNWKVFQFKSTGWQQVFQKVKLNVTVCAAACEKQRSLMVNLRWSLGGQKVQDHGWSSRHLSLMQTSWKTLMEISPPDSYIHPWNRTPFNLKTVKPRKEKWLNNSRWLLCVDESRVKVCFMLGSYWNDYFYYWNDS